MDSFSSFFQSHSSSRSRWSYDSLKNFRQISPVVQKYLKQVYLMLCCALIASAVGVYMHLLWYIGDFLATVGCIGSMIWLLSTPPYEEKKRVALLMAAALFEVASVGPLVDLAIEIDPRHQHHGPAISVIECPKIHSMNSGIRVLNDFLCVSIPCNACDSYYQALGWQIVAAKIGMQRCVASSQWLNEKISLSRYAHVPLGNFKLDWLQFIADIFFSRVLSDQQQRDLMAQFVDDSLHEVVGFRKAWHGLVLLAPKGHGICLAQASRIRFEFHKGAADHTFMRIDGEPWKQPLPVDDDTAVVEISHLCQVNMLATQDCRSRSVYDPSTPSSHQGDDEDSNEEDSGEDWEERRKFGAADTFRILTMSDISQLKNLSLPPPGDLESGIEA